MSHTPGPWKVEPVEGDGIGPVGVLAGPFRLEPLESLHVQVAKVNRHGEWTVPNARLISAAPDLLAALEGLLRICPCIFPGMTSNYPAAVIAADAAIAKAKGVEQK